MSLLVSSVLNGFFLLLATAFFFLYRQSQKHNKKIKQQMQELNQSLEKTIEKRSKSLSKKADELASSYRAALSLMEDAIEAKKKLEKAQTELTRSHMGLEKRVQERTLELDEAKGHLEDYARELERSNHELEQFAYIASHDLQEPLRTIVSYGCLLEEEYTGQLGESGKMYITRMQRAGNRMKQLIEDLLAYSRVRKSPTAPESVSLVKIMQQVEQNMEILVKKTHTKIELDPKLPAVAGIPSQILQLFQNLLSNAIKFAKAELAPEVKINLENISDGMATLAIQDNGIGIEEKYHELIFKPFYRVQRNEQFPGTGIGLAICKKIIEQHGGSISIKKSSAEGSQILITLPLAEQAPQIETEQHQHVSN